MVQIKTLSLLLVTPPRLKTLRNSFLLANYLEFTFTPKHLLSHLVYTHAHTHRLKGFSKNKSYQSNTLLQMAATKPVILKLSSVDVDIANPNMMGIRDKLTYNPEYSPKQKPNERSSD